MKISELNKTETVPLAINYKGERFIGEARPLMSSLVEGEFLELDVLLNKEELGTIHHTKGGWRMDKIVDQDFIDVIAEEIRLWY